MKHAPLPDFRKAPLRTLVEALEDASRHLQPEQRELVRALCCQGVPAHRLAALRARSESPRSLRRRVKTLARRALSPHFQFVLARRDHWPPERRLVATLCVLEGRTMKDAADRASLTLHAVRAHMHAVRALMSAHVSTRRSRRAQERAA